MWTFETTTKNIVAKNAVVKQFFFHLLLKSSLFFVRKKCKQQAHFTNRSFFSVVLYKSESKNVLFELFLSCFCDFVKISLQDMEKTGLNADNNNM